MLGCVDDGWVESVFWSVGCMDNSLWFSPPQLWGGEALKAGAASWLSRRCYWLLRVFSVGMDLV